jgi:hypothetical protein
MSVTPVSRERLTSAAAARRNVVRVRAFILIIGTTRRLRMLHVMRSGDDRWELGFVPEAPDADGPPLDGPCPVTLVLGDDAEWNEVGDGGCMGNAVAVRVDLAERSVQVWSSITGLPSVFLSRRPDGLVLTSDLSLLAATQTLRLDAVAVADLFQRGYPSDDRSLFEDTSLVPGGHVVRVGVDDQFSVARAWSFPKATRGLDWPSYLDLQAQTFRDAMRRLDLSRSFFSLTSGVDTRTILAALVSEGVSLPTATLSGATLSLDARVARTLSETYALPHHVVCLDANFLRNLPTYVTETSRRSGGLTGLEEAGEVYFYQQLTGLGTRRLGGGFGNQVAHQGLERVSPRGADLTVLAEEFVSTRTRGAGAAVPSTTRWHSSYERYLQENGTFPSVGNACIGQGFATQQTPYASRAMIESLAWSPAGLEAVGSLSRSQARRRDLHHRFLGEPRTRSFQRVLIAATGGRLASYPINWGWRASGGISARGLAMGALACLDQVASWPAPGSRGLGKLLHLIGAEGLQEIKPYRAWLTDWLKDFVHDTLLSHATRDSGMFNTAALAHVLRDHYILGKPHTGTIMAALDLALAHQLFCVDPERSH